MTLRKLIILIFFSVVITSPAFAQSSDKIKLTVSEWPPYMSENLKGGGLALNVVEEAFALEGIAVEYGWFPPKRSYVVPLKDNEWNGTAVWTKTEEREMKYFYTDPIFKVEDVFFHRKDFPLKWDAFTDLKDLSIGATIGYYYGEAFKTAEEKGIIHVERIPTDENNFRKLLAGRIHVFPQAIEVGYYMLGKNFTKHQAAQITHHPKVVEEFTFYLLLSKNNPKNKRFIAKFNKGMQKFRESGECDKLFKEYKKVLYEK